MYTQTHTMNLTQPTVWTAPMKQELKTKHSRQCWRHMEKMDSFVSSTLPISDMKRFSFLAVSWSLAAYRLGRGGWRGSSCRVTKSDWSPRLLQAVPPITFCQARCRFLARQILDIGNDKSGSWKNPGLVFQVTITQLCTPSNHICPTVQIPSKTAF